MKYFGVRLGATANYPLAKMAQSGPHQKRSWRYSIRFAIARRDQGYLQRRVVGNFLVSGFNYYVVGFELTETAIA